jgi:hypothetical protein
VLALLAAVRRIPIPVSVTQRARPVATYAIGTLAAFWFVERVAGFV